METFSWLDDNKKENRSLYRECDCCCGNETTGPAGPAGAPGPQGIPGEQGEAGNDGNNGTDGKNGKDGKDGVTPNVQVGTVETLNAGTQAYANMTGTVTNPLLNLGIPQGASGTGSALIYATMYGALLNDVDQPSVVVPGGRIPWKSITNNGQGLLKPAANTSYFQFTKLGRYLCIFSLRCATKVSADNGVINWGLYAQSIAKSMVTSASAFVTTNMSDISGVGIFDVTDLTEQYNLINNSMMNINVQGATAAQTFHDSFIGFNGVNQIDGMSCVFLRLGDAA